MGLKLDNFDVKSIARILLILGNVIIETVN